MIQQGQGGLPAGGFVTGATKGRQAHQIGLKELASEAMTLSWSHLVSVKNWARAEQIHIIMKIM